MWEPQRVYPADFSSAANTREKGVLEFFSIVRRSAVRGCRRVLRDPTLFQVGGIFRTQNPGEAYVNVCSARG